MAVARRISEHRPTIILVVLVVLSLISLASGAPAIVVGDGLRSVVSIAAYPFWKVARGVEKCFDYTRGLLVSYDELRDANESLRQDLANMAHYDAVRSELSAENKRLRRLMDFERNEPRLVLQPAEVLRRFEGTLTIDLGAVHGVKELMCAVTPDGVVGIVTRVERYESSISTLHDPSCRLNAMIRRNRARGIVHGSRSDVSHVCTMQYVDLKDDIRPGDVIVTSGGSVFPSGYPIGTVTDVDDRGPLLKVAYVEPAADPYQVDEVFLVWRADETVADLAGGGVSVARPAPDVADRSLQERLAP